MLLFLFLPDFFERGDKMASLRFSDVFKSLNVAYGIEKDDSVVNFNVSTGATNYLSSQSEASDVNKRFNDIGDVDSYFSFCEPLLQAKGADSTENPTLSEISNEEVEVIARDSVPQDIIAEDGNLAGNSKKSKKKSLRKIEERLERDKSKHPLLPPCSCKSLCIERIPGPERKVIHADFWKLSYDERTLFMHSRITRESVKRHRKNTKRGKERGATFSCSFFAYGEDRKICHQSFFLSTQGYKSNRVLMTIAEKSKKYILPAKDKRCPATPENKLSDEQLKDLQAHIMSYDPSISHY